MSPAFDDGLHVFARELQNGNLILESFGNITMPFAVTGRNRSRVSRARNLRHQLAGFERIPHPQREVALRDNSYDAAGSIHNGNSSDSAFLHQLQRFIAVVVRRARQDIARHDLANCRGLRITALGKYLNRKVAIRDDANEMLFLLILDNRKNADVRLLHTLCGFSDTIGRKAADRIFSHQITALLRLHVGDI
jgi:hypothetical protein